MEILTLATLIVVGAYILKSRDQRQRIALVVNELGGGKMPGAAVFCGVDHHW